LTRWKRHLIEHPASNRRFFDIQCLCRFAGTGMALEQVRSLVLRRASEQSKGKIDVAKRRVCEMRRLI
jgi:hypothetical protein